MALNPKHGGKRAGAGRKAGTTKAEGMTTKVVRVSTELENPQYQNLPTLISLLYQYEEELLAAKAEGKTTRTWDKFEQFLDEAKQLGY